MTAKSFNITFLCVFAAASICMGLPAKYGFVSGILMLCAGVILSKYLWSNWFSRSQEKEFDSFLVSNKAGRQLLLLLGVVLDVFIIISGAILILVPFLPCSFFFAGSSEVSSVFGQFLHLAHRYLGYNYYPDGVGMNTAVFVLSLFGTFFFGGLLITTFSNILQQRREELANGQKVYNSFNNHFVVIGYGEFTAPLVQSLLIQEPTCSIIVLTEQKVTMVRDRLLSYVGDKQIKRVFFYFGSLQREETLSTLCLHSAKGVFILGEGEGFGKDAKNLECAKRITHVLTHEKKKRADILPVHIHLDKPSTYSILQKLRIPKVYYQDSGVSSIYIRPFNYYENWARSVWGSTSGASKADSQYKPLDQEFSLIPGVNKHVHLVIAGLDHMGTALLFEAIRLCHFPNFREESGENKTIITIVDRNMSKKKDIFLAKYPYLQQIKDIEIQYEPCELEATAFREKLKAWALDESTILTVAVCFYDPDESLSSAISLPEELYYTIRQEDKCSPYKVVPAPQVQILVRQQMRGGMGAMLEENKPKYSNVKVFGMRESEENNIHGVFDLTSYFDDIIPMCVAACYDLSNTELKNAEGVIVKSDGKPIDDKDRGMKYRDIITEYNNYFPVTPMDRSSELNTDAKGKGIVQRIDYPPVLDYLIECRNKTNGLGKDDELYQKAEEVIKRIKDLMLENWNEMSEDLRFSNRYQVDMYPTFIRYKNLLEQNGFIKDLSKDHSWLSQMEHLRWVADRCIIGYRDTSAYMLKDIDSYKLHWDIRPYHPLDKNEQAKDKQVIENLNKVETMASIIRQYAHVNKEIASTKCLKKNIRAKKS